MKLTLLGCPLSVNATYATMCYGRMPSRYMTKRGKELKASYQEQATHAFNGPIRQNKLCLGINLYFDSHRKHDIDNYGKVLLDSLTGIVWEDDSQIHKMTVEKHYDKENPRVELDIQDYE